MSAAVEPAVEVRGLARRFGEVNAVRDVSFTMEKGQVLGFIGANGAGKTTTMRIMATLDLPDSGWVRISGRDALNEPEQVRGRIGWMPDSYGAYPNTTVWEYLDFFARAFGLKGSERASAVRDVMSFIGLEELCSREMTSLSKGMSQRLCLGRALLHDPEVLILDEPAAGLDPRARVEFKRLVRLLSEEGKTIFISSHILSELEEMCDSVLFIDDGSIVHSGSAESLKSSTSEGVIYLVSLATPDSDRAGIASLLRFVDASPGVEVLETTKSGARLRFESSEPARVADVLRRLVSAGIAVVDFRREERRLEQAFIDTLERNEAKR